MDNLIHSFQSTEEVQLCVSDLKPTLQKGGFSSTKFATNKPNILKMLESEHIESETEDHRVLGLLWNSPIDIFFHKNLSKIDQPTSQYTLCKLLSLIAGQFDPMGIIAPIVITLKKNLHDTWKEGLSWDDLLSLSKRQQIRDWIDKDLDSPQIQMPRNFSLLDISSGSNQLHVFCDASQLAYGAVIYIKTSNDRETSSNFVIGRAKVAPLKQISITKLELHAAVLGCRLWQFVTQHLSVPIKESIFWSERTAVLGWINSKDKLKTFIANCVQEIRNLTGTSCGQHIFGKKILPITYLEEFYHKTLTPYGCRRQSF